MGRRSMTRGLESIQQILLELVRPTESAEREEALKDQLENLIDQLYSSGILYSEAVREFKKKFIVKVIKENRGNQCKAGRELGMHRNTLNRTITGLQIDMKEYGLIPRSRRHSRPPTKPTVQPVAMAATAGARRA